MSNSVRPQRLQPTRLPRPWDSPGKNTGVGCHLLLQCMKVKSESEVAQSCLTLCDPMDCSPPGSSIHGIFQARVLERRAIAFSDEMVKEMEKFDQEKRVQSTSFAHFWSVRRETLGASWHWQVGINPQQVSPISRMRSLWNRRAGLLTCCTQGMSFIHTSTPYSQ